MFKINGFAAAAAFVAAGLTVASVASAAPLQPAAERGAVSAATPQKRVVVAGDRRVCVVGDPSTALPRKTCMRYSDWLNAGVDPLADRTS